MTIVLLPEEMDGKSLKKFNRRNKTNILAKPRKNLSEKDNEDIKEKTDKALLLLKLSQGKLKLIGRKLKT
jgi:hypothetical protein